MPELNQGRFYALLIGIDGYERMPLSGCVNDIDDVATFLVERVGVAADSIRKLTAPAAERPKPTELGANAPTYAGIVSALQSLAGEPVQAGDSVLFYYSGHGSAERIPAAQSYYEGLVPLDYEQAGLLFDVELNRLLQEIAQRSHDLTVILDCCHSGGATRDLLPDQPNRRTRFLPLDHDEAKGPSPGAARLVQRGLLSLPWEQTQEYTVLAACHADEKASECNLPPPDGRQHGLLSYCLLDLLRQCEPRSLAKLRWNDIWEPLKAAMLELNSSQRPQILGPRERHVFGGPWQPQDLGYSVQLSADGTYTIGAGSLAGLGPGAQLAVYGPEPALFPTLHSEADKQARLGTLIIECVTPAQSQARPVQKDVPMALPGPGRGRLISLGEPDLLRVALSPGVAPDIRSQVAKTARCDRFTIVPDGDRGAEAYVGQFPDGDLWIGDDLFAPADPGSPGAMGRVRLAEARTADSLVTGLRAGLNHYAQYVIPLRIYRHGGFTLPQQAIAVRLLDCDGLEQAQGLEHDSTLRREARKDERGRYCLRSGARVAIHVTNGLALSGLNVSLLLCNMQGRIQLLDSDVLINPRSGKIFWADTIVGSPFVMICPKTRLWGIDRLIVIATDEKGIDLSILNQHETMDQAIQAAMNSRDVMLLAGKRLGGTRFTAAQVLLHIESQPSPSGKGPGPQGVI